MEPRGERPAWLPAETDGRPPRLPDPTPEPDAAPRWARLIRSPRGAAGIAILAAALLLWPFTVWSVWPWLIGLGVLVLLYLLRLDRLMRGWAPHLAGIAVVGGMLYGTSPWAWALAASIGVLLAGLALLPRWKVVAVGAVLCVVSGAGFGISTYQARAEAEQTYQRGGDLTRSEIPEVRNDILPALIQAIDSSVPDPQPLCRLATADALGQLQAVLGTSTCEESVEALFHRRESAGIAVDQPSATLPKPQPEPGEARMAIDGCNTVWGRTAGRSLGRIHIVLVNADDKLYNVAGFSTC